MGRGWCSVDPIIKVDGRTFSIAASAFTENDRLAAAIFRVFVPSNAKTDIVDKSSNQNIADDYRGIVFVRMGGDEANVIITFTGTAKPGDEGCAIELRTNTEHGGHRVSTGTLYMTLSQEFTPARQPVHAD